MKRLRRFIRALMLTLLLLVVALPTGMYVVLSTPWAQDKIRDVACSQLTSLLGTPVEIGRVDYHPFNTLSVTDICVRDATGRPALEVGRLSARFEFWHFLRTHRLVFDYALVDALQLSVSRAAPDRPLNIQPVIDRLKPKHPGNTPTQFDLKIGTVVIRAARLRYDVASIPDSTDTFNPAHILVSDLNLHAYLRNARPNYVDAKLESLSFKEKSGFELRDFTADVLYSPEVIDLRTFTMRLPDTGINLKPIRLALDSSMSLADNIRRAEFRLQPQSPWQISTADFACLTPELGSIDLTATVDFDITASTQMVTLHSLKLDDSHGARVNLSAVISRPDSINGMHASATLNSLNISAADGADIMGHISPAAARYIGRTGGIGARGSIDFTMRRAALDIGVDVGTGHIDIDGTASTSDRYHNIAFDGKVAIANISAGTIISEPRLGAISANATGKGHIRNGRVDAEGSLDIISASWLDHTYSDINVQGSYSPDGTSLSINSSDPDAAFVIAIDAATGKHDKALDLTLDLHRLDPAALGLMPAEKTITGHGRLEASLTGSDVDDIGGFVRLHDISLVNARDERLDIQSIAVEADRSSVPETVTISSDFLNGTIQGSINPSTLPAIIRDMASHIVPSLFSADESLHRHLTETESHNDFTVDLTLANAENLTQFMHLPVQVIYPVDIDMHLSSATGLASFTLDAPYLQQGDKIIDSTVIGATVSTVENRATLYATTHLPTKKGPMTAILGISGAGSRFDTQIDWQIDRKIPLNGRISFATDLSRSESGTVCVSTHFNPGTINFGDDVWSIKQSDITWCDHTLAVNGFGLAADSQSISIDGVASKQPDDTVTVKLDHINLISIFETLEIDNALIGGTATGTFTASQALSGLPLLDTDNLHVDNISYNYCTIGDADITARWDNERQSFFLDADIVNPEGQHSRISGDIFPLKESLDLKFDAQHVKVGFMKPFMAAFTSDVSGYVSGNARLFGTFKDIDMEGDVFAEDLKLKIDFTNTTYSATDSIHIRPGRIDLHDITLHDVNGHTALLNGVLTHDYFHRPEFEFHITDARDFLSYNVTSKLNPDWYGTVYGNGGATVKGRPGEINIGVDMRTAAGSTFTFVLSDQLEAEQYSFITFNDVTEYSVEEKMMQTGDTPQAVLDFQQRMRDKAADKPSNYIMDIRVDITPQAQIILVMDPVGGDRIRANGSGDLRMTYNADENDLRMYGTYTLEHGSYNFTLQDIIIKDFTIEPGSTITFRGDPYSAQLDLEAVYQVNANLSDLDKSFTQDKDLNRTNVPVQALMKVSGDMRQPDLDFDLRFPTLTSDTYRKVRSIISTDDMMNRQIIYLLALNRFYTPDYMESTTKGNELFSVASSTISSQLSSMLGKLSDNWSIAPNLRSDRGDFSDVEVDVALSSRLLNNRLLFNGNFGYRDKSLNSNQFIGDFDIEYLLNPRGTWRLKAYNRYNDQNYYVRTATTTQGVGIMFRRDFDLMFHKRRKKKDNAAAPADSVQQTVPADSTEHNNLPAGVLDK